VGWVRSNKAITRKATRRPLERTKTLDRRRSLDAVYRTLSLLEDLGLVRALGPRRGATRFDANLDAHHHFVCERCGAVRDFEHAAFDRLGIPKGVETFGEARGVRVEIRGICNGCLKTETSSRGRKA
jgi:Fe2+ or Zn2+ uptake regulation protein